MYCNNNTETALHAAVKGKHYDIVLALLNAGASPNCVIKAYHDIEVQKFRLFSGLFERC
jgi:ankyrin repeat protein